MIYPDIEVIGKLYSYELKVGTVLHLQGAFSCLSGWEFRYIIPEVDHPEYGRLCNQAYAVE